ncbi:PREDICTED: semaphorin-4B-like [Cyprinodon variegatus]|uniref:semaphorin-4B-like n=1 Tax=Cyprinodon variegatus TaxID=28743 RepID=UPI0007428B78|nr:PREDICTED: semaphorin-4B-like [Cyprinodon variegatus]
MASSVLLLLLLLLDSTRSLLPPRISFLLNSTDRPLNHFSLPDVSNTTTLLLSNDASTLYVGARNAILSLDVSQSDVIQLNKQVTWSPSEAEMESCAGKGKNRQFIKKTTSSFFHIVTHWFDWVKLPFFLSSAPSVGFSLSADEELFTASTTDFKGRTPQISRFLSKDGRPDVNLDSSVSRLEEPTFVSSSLDPAEKKLHIFFNEVGKEFNFVRQLQIPRVAQVCKDDVGGQRTLQKKWTSFAKSSLLCQLPKQLPFNILEDIFTLQPPEGADTSETLFYGVFSSQWSIRPESAVCIFKLTDIRKAFSGSFKTLEKETYQLKLSQRRDYLGKCGLSNASDAELSEVKKSFLTNEDVHPAEKVLVFPEQKYSRMVVMTTQAANGKQFNILFLLTESGFLHKVVSLDQGPRVIEEIQVFKEPQQVKSMIISSSKRVLYVGTSEGVTAVPVARCSVYRSCSQCLLARDPLCGWSQTRRTCTALDGSSTDIIQKVEGDIVGTECQPSDEHVMKQEVVVRLNELVKLDCPKPSNLATLSWSFSGTRALPSEFPQMRADGSLMFFASPMRFGGYRCQAKEDGLRELVVIYTVREAYSPRHLPKPVTETLASQSPGDENIGTEEPTVSDGHNNETTTKDGEVSEPKNILEADIEERVTVAKGETFSRKTHSTHDGSGSEEPAPTSRTDSRSMLNPSQSTPNQRSYYSELVAVTFLLVVCLLVLALGFLWIWKQKKAVSRGNGMFSPEDKGRTNMCMQVSELTTLEGGPDQTFTQ